MIKSIKDALKSAASIAVSLAIFGIAAVAILVGGLFVVSWLSAKSPDHYVCEGTYLTVNGDQETRYPKAQLGIVFEEPTWFGSTAFDLEPNYEYVVNALPDSVGANSQRNNDSGLSYSELTDQLVIGDESDDIMGRTVLYFERLNGYVGLSNRKDSDGFIWGFDFDGFCTKA